MTAANIANANSRGFRPSHVRFEDSLRAAALRGTEAVRQVQANIAADPVVPGAEPRTDLELESASETAMRYSALAELLGREVAIDRIVVRGGQA